MSGNAQIQDSSQVLLFGGSGVLLNRSHYALVVAVFIGGNLLLDKLLASASGGLNWESFLSAVGTLNAFQIIAWVVALQLIRKSDEAAPASILVQCLAILAMTAVVLANMMSHRGLFDLTVSLAAIALFLISPRRSTMRAAGIVFCAIAANALWGPALFAIAAEGFLEVDALVVGAAIKAMFPDIVWQGAVIVAPDKHSVVLIDGCASFHNMSLALLCWTAVTMHARAYWRRADILVGAAACLAMFAMNAARIVLMAHGRDLYFYWHDGVGKDLFSAAVTVVMAMICVVGVQIVGDRK